MSNRNGYENGWNNGCQNNYNGCGYRAPFEGNGCGRSGYNPQGCHHHHDETIVDVHVEVPEHHRYW